MLLNGNHRKRALFLKQHEETMKLVKPIVPVVSFTPFTQNLLFQPMKQETKTTEGNPFGGQAGQVDQLQGQNQLQSGLGWRGLA